VLDAASAVLAAPRRVSPPAAWRIRLVSVGVGVLMSLGVGVWVMSTDEVAALAAVVGIHAVKTVKTQRPAVAVIVDVPAADAATVARYLGRDHLEASIATTAALERPALHALSEFGDVPMPAIGHYGPFGWIRTSSQLRREARALHLHHRFYYLEPPNPSLGELLLARTAGALPVRGSLALDPHTPLPKERLRAGAVIVVSLGGSSTGSLRVLDRLARALQSDGLIGLPLSDLTS
jgi:hypothetical protein